jgi:DNA polymerase IIIc chi subunit
MKTIVTNNNPVNPLNFFIIVVLLELVLVSSLRRIVIAVQNRSTEVFDGVSGDDDELDLASGKWGWSLRQAAWSKD